MKNMKNKTVSNILIFSVAFLLMSCDPNEKARVLIEYEQIANIDTYTLSGGSTTSIDGIYILYKIRKITNTGTEAKSFTFNPNLVVTIAPDKTSNTSPTTDHILLGDQLAENIVVQPGQTLQNPGCIIKSVFTDNPQAIYNTTGLVNLTGKINSSQPISMSRVAGNTTVALMNAAPPSQLQHSCGL